MERLSGRQRNGITTVGMRNWGMLFVICGIVSRGILQNRMLGMADGNTAHLLDTMMNHPDAMGIATLALVMQAMETCAAPVFCFLLVEGFTRTKDYFRNLLRMAGVAVVSEIPYNFAIDGQILSMSTRNPVFALVICLIMLFLFRHYEARKLANTAIKFCVLLASFIWCKMLGIQDGGCCVIICAVLWWCRNRPNYRNLIACSATVACMLFSPFFMAAPMGFMVIHFYNGEKGEESTAVRYAMYPAILLVIGIAGRFLPGI